MSYPRARMSGAADAMSWTAGAPQGVDLTGKALTLTVTVATLNRTVVLSSGWSVSSRTASTATFSRTFDGTELVASDPGAMWAATMTYDGAVARQTPQNIPIKGEMEA